MSHDNASHDNAVEQIRRYTELLNNSDKQTQISFVREILSKPTSADSLDALIKTLIVKSYELGVEIGEKNYKKNTTDTSRAKLIENADNYAQNIAPHVRQIITRGCVTLQNIANELNDSRIYTKNGYLWNASSLKLLIERINKLAPENPINLKNFDPYTNEMIAKITNLKEAGCDNASAIADALNAQGITTKKGNKWYPSSVARLLDKRRHDTPSNGHSLL